MTGSWAAGRPLRSMRCANSTKRANWRLKVICRPAPNSARSCIRVPSATFQPSLTRPTTFAAGTRTLSKNSSLNSVSPVIWRRSGNPAGKSKGRARFEEAFNEARITQGSAEEAAQLLWQAARGKEPWAIQEVCRRFAPQTQSLHLIQEVNDDKFDYSKFTD